MTWAASTATIQRRFDYPLVIKPAHRFHVGEQVFLALGVNVYQRGIVSSVYWLGFRPVYTVRLAYGKVIHVNVEEHELRGLGTVYGLAA
jgi:hypothetical protein